MSKRREDVPALPTPSDTRTSRRIKHALVLCDATHTLQPAWRSGQPSEMSRWCGHEAIELGFELERRRHVELSADNDLDGCAALAGVPARVAGGAGRFVAGHVARMPTAAGESSGAPGRG
jgi:hypothetical protein